jgi:hypothetical protein
LEEKMTAENPKGTYGQSEKASQANPKQTAVDELLNLFREAALQMKQTPSALPPLEGPALAAAVKYEEIKKALGTPTIPSTTLDQS